MSASGPRDRRAAPAIALVVVATLLIRALYLGDPVIDADEQFYLLAGDRWLHGAIPYVDIWDRKPVGLFVLYAGIRLLGGEGIVQYQVVAALSAAATGVLIFGFARRLAGTWPATIAALAYPLAIGWSGGMGGQSPVFYNLPMALAAMLTLDALERPRGPGPLLAWGAAAMLLVGIALQIKYSALFEGVFFGLALLWAARRQGCGWARVAGCGLAWIAVALAPTLLAWGLYAAFGHEPAFRFANFTSILLRPNEPFGYQARAFAKMVARLLPELLVLAGGGLAVLWTGRRWVVAEARGTWRFILGWAIASAAGILIFGNFFNHYALPLMVPLAIATAPAFALRPRAIGIGLAALALTANGVAYGITWRHILARSGDRAYAARIAGVVRAHLGGGCLYVFNGEPILYHLARSCLPTRWPFPYHLSFQREAPALGVDPVAEVRAIMARRPSVIVDTYDPGDPDINRAAQAVVRDEIARHYRPVAAFHLLKDVRIVYARR